MRGTKLMRKTTTQRRLGTFALAASMGALLLAAPAQANADEAGAASAVSCAAPRSARWARP